MKSGCLLGKLFLLLGNELDCEQSLSFPSVFLAFLRASVELSSSELRDANTDTEEGYLLHVSPLCVNFQ